MTITVVIPLYNKKNTIVRALDSVLNQQVLPDRIIVVNDGSKDGSEKEVENLNHPLITLVHQENKGVSAARNKGIEVAKSEWIAFLDADDYWCETFIKEIFNLIKVSPKIKAIGTNYYIKNNDSLIVNYLKRSQHIKDNSINDYFKFAAFNNPPIWSSAVALKKSLFIKINGFEENLHSGEDLLMWAKIALVTNYGYINKPLAVWNFDDATVRIPENPDIFSKLFLELIKNQSEESTKVKLKNYLLYWKKIRISQYISHKDIRFLSELIQFLKIKFFPF